MAFDPPNINEIEMLIDFCKNNKNIYIYGCAENQLFLTKYLKICDIEIKGFIISRKLDYENSRMGIPVYSIEEINAQIKNKNEIAIIMALPSMYYNETLVTLQSMGIKNLFFMSEYNKRTISYKMKPRIKEQFWLEVNVVDHCNLNCQMCDHFSPIAEQAFLDINSYENDMKRLSEISGEGGRY